MADHFGPMKTSQETLSNTHLQYRFTRVDSGSLDGLVLSVHNDMIKYTRHFPPVQESLVSFLSIFSFEIDTFIKAKSLESRRCFLMYAQEGRKFRETRLLVTMKI